MGIRESIEYLALGQGRSLWVREKEKFPVVTKKNAEENVIERVFVVFEKHAMKEKKKFKGTKLAVQSIDLF